jgi:oxygen-independent coproporphyrinogen-3 oxidase
MFDRYVDRVCSDIERAPQTASEMGGELEGVVDSIYLGGGTPTMLAPEQLKRIFDAVQRQFAVSPDAEVTVECAPGTLTPALIETLLRCGVNRVSLGVQSFIDQEATAVGRLHKRATVLDDIARLRDAGIANINIDLIAGLPHQTAKSWEFSLAETVASEAPHVSVYMLEVDEDSRLGRELLAGGTRYHAHFVPDEEAVADFYVAACERLNSAGVKQYEISNFAREGFESRHNLKYWTRQPYFGFGVDAHSMLRAVAREGNREEDREEDREGREFTRAAETPSGELGFSPCGPDAVRFSSSDSLDLYTNTAAVTRTDVSRREALEESFFLGLRLTEGVNLRELSARFGEAAVDVVRPAIAEFVEAGLMKQREDVVHLTERGRLLSNDVFERFIAQEVAK